MRTRIGVGVVLAVLVALVAAPSALAETPVLCSDLPALFGTGAGAATAGGVYQLPPGVCKTNVLPTPTANPNAFTLEGASAGGPTMLEPASTSLPIIEANGNVSFTLSGLTFTGANGATALAVDGSETPVTLTGDTFTDNLGEGAVLLLSLSVQPNVISANTFSGNTSAGIGAGLALQDSGAYTITGNTFNANASTAVGSGLGGGGLSILSSPAAATGAVVISNNTFGGTAESAGNTDHGEGAGAFVALQHGQALTVTGNTFENNSIAGTNTAAGSRLGAGLFIGLSSGATSYNAVQSGNSFLDNTITETEVSPAPPQPLAAGGAGEWISGVSVQSTDDRFVGNRVAVNDGLPPEGGGLGVHASGIYTLVPPTPAQPAAFVGSNDLFSANSVAAGGWGGGAYVGGVVNASPDCTGTCPGSSLTLDDSTIVGNSVNAGTGSQGGAFWGTSLDTLALANSIVYGNTPQPEIYGFAASPSLQYSDVCTEAGGPAVPSGAGDICANPALNADGTETVASPTVDAGSNALVPSGLTTDLAGNPRILASRLTCGSAAPAVVDMGAFEATFHGPPPGCPLVVPPTPTPTVTSVSQSASKWLESNHLATITKVRHKLPVGTAFKFTLSEPATVDFSFQHSATGRKVSTRCVAKTKRNARKRHCTFTTTPGTMTFAGHAGANTVHFYGRVNPHTKLKPGSYTLIITATAAGKTSSPAKLRFTIAPPPPKNRKHK